MVLDQVLKLPCCPCSCAVKHQVGFVLHGIVRAFPESGYGEAFWLLLDNISIFFFFTGEKTGFGFSMHALHCVAFAQVHIIASLHSERSWVGER